MTRTKRIFFALLGIVIAACFVWIGILYFKNSYLRIYESLIDCINSVKYYFCKLFNVSADLNATVIEQSHIYNPDVGLPPTPGEIGMNVTSYWALFFSRNNFLNWCSYTMTNV